MCRIYASTDPERYASTTRSVRLQGYVTSIRLENEFWRIIETLATEDGLPVSRFISRLYDEVIADQGEVGNLTSMLRVACAIYLQQRITPAQERRRVVALPSDALSDSR